MLTEMAHSSERMRFKDKIIANIAKAIKGIQAAVFFRNQTAADDSPLILRNNDRQCHKLCENLDHVFLHGLKHHSDGYWKVVTEYTHKNAVREIHNLRNVTTNLGRGRAWIFMALNESLLESYIRCVTEHTKFLKKYYAKDALLLDQQQMSVLLTLTSGLECVVFQLEYDLPYLDLTAYPPRTRTASEVKEDVPDHVSLRSAGSFSSQTNSETAASTPESTKALTDSDTASVSSLDTPALHSSSARMSSVSMDSGFPGDILSIQSSKQRSVTPTDTTSISSHGSAGEPDRLMRLENMISRAEEVDEMGGGLEVIRVKGGRKLSAGGGKKKKQGSSKKSAKRVVSPVSQISSTTVVESSDAGMHGSGDSLFNSTTQVDAENSQITAHSSDGVSVEVGSPNGKSPPFGKSPPYGRSPPYGKSPPCRQCPQSDAPSGESSSKARDSPEVNDVDRREEKAESASVGSERDTERLAAETKDSLADGLAQLDTTMASIRATTTTLHQHKEQEVLGRLGWRPESVEKSSQNGAPFQNEASSPHAVVIPAKDLDRGYFMASAVVCDNEVRDSPPVVPGQARALPEAAPAGRKKMSALEELESVCAQLCRPLSDGDYGQPQLVSSVAKNAKDRLICSESDKNHLCEDGEVPAEDASERLNRAGQEEEEEEEVDFYSAPSKAGVNRARTHSCSQVQDYVDYISGHHDNQPAETLDAAQQREENKNELEKEGREWIKDYALRLDNNTKLQIMLDIFSRDDEEFIKMFATREGHSEGNTKVTFVLVTNFALYLLKRKDLDHKFEAELAIPLKDLSFISLSLNKQIVNIESSGPSRRKERIWLTPGDHLLAQQILDCLEGAMKNVQHPTTLRSRCSIGSDEPLQVIALRKYISRDSGFEEQDVEIEDYSLVFWEDTQTNKNKQTSTAREGTMLLRVSDPFKGHLWKPVYVVLRDFMLCLFANKADSKPQQYVRLGGEQCVGCRLATTQDRPHCIEIILAKGGSWFLSVASEGEVASWRQSLCMAVSEGMQDSSNLSCLPCVSVVTKQKLLLCHEDVQTKFCRTIASAKVEEVTSLTLDPEVNTYCVVEFESQELGVSSEQWVLYFNSPLEMDRFVQALSTVWKEVYQVSLIAGSIEDLPLQKHCQDQVTLLQQAVSLK